MDLYLSVFIFMYLSFTRCVIKLMNNILCNGVFCCFCYFPFSVRFSVKFCEFHQFENISENQNIFISVLLIIIDNRLKKAETSQRKSVEIVFNFICHLLFHLLSSHNSRKARKRSIFPYQSRAPTHCEDFYYSFTLHSTSF